MTLKIVIAGGGKVGTYLASLLIRDGHAVRIVEGSESEYPRIISELGQEVLIRGNGTNPEVLRTAGIREADVLAAVTRNDELNLVITSLARFEFRVPRTVARVNIPKNSWLFTPEMGVDVVLNQADLMAHLIAEELTIREMKTLLKLQKGEFSLMETPVHKGSAADRAAIRDLPLPAECVITAVIRDATLIIPRGDTVLKEGDQVLTVVHRTALPGLEHLMQYPGRQA